MKKKEINEHYRASLKSLYTDFYMFYSMMEFELTLLREINNKILTLLSNEDVRKYAENNGLCVCQKVVDNVFAANHKVANSIQAKLELFSQRANQAKLYKKVEGD